MKRPEGWKNRYTNIVKEKPYLDTWTVEDAEIAYEDGADAYAKGIKEELDKAFNDCDRLIIIQRMIE